MEALDFLTAGFRPQFFDQLGSSDVTECNHLWMVTWDLIRWDATHHGKECLDLFLVEAATVVCIKMRHQLLYHCLRRLERVHLGPELRHTGQRFLFAPPHLKRAGDRICQLLLLFLFLSSLLGRQYPMITITAVTAVTTFTRQ